MAKQDNMPKFRLGGVGTPGLRQFNGRVLEATRKDLIFPYSVRTYKEMSYDPSIASAQIAIQDVIRNTKYKVIDGENKEHSEHIRQCMDDMEGTWDQFIHEALSMLTYGFSVQEKVFKYRRGQSGKYKSKYNDNLVGWAKLPQRSQDTLDKWYWKDKGRELAGVRQNLALVPNGEIRYGKTHIPMARQQFLLFNLDAQRGNPEGTSPLSKAYIPWKYKSEIENYEAIGISRQFQGFPVFGVPPEWLAEDAPDDKKAVISQFNAAIENLKANEQAGLVMPRVFDSESKQDLFSFELMTVNGSAMHDTNKVIDRYESKMLMVYLADVLKLGQESVGSFALADAKTSLLAIRISAILQQTMDVINKDLIPHTFKLNNWDDTELPEVMFEDLEELSLDELGKYIQRIVSVNAVEVDKEMSSALRERIRLPAKTTDPLDEKFLASSDSKSGEGMKTSGEGTAKEQGGGDSSTSNKENN